MYVVLLKYQLKCWTLGTSWERHILWFRIIYLLSFYKGVLSKAVSIPEILELWIAIPFDHLRRNWKFRNRFLGWNLFHMWNLFQMWNLFHQLNLFHAGNCLTQGAMYQLCKVRGGLNCPIWIDSLAGVDSLPGIDSPTGIDSPLGIYSPKWRFLLEKESIHQNRAEIGQGIGIAIPLESESAQL